MYLESLLLEESELNVKIKAAMEKLITWFKEKIAKIKEVAKVIKEKMVAKLKRLTMNKTQKLVSDVYAGDIRLLSKGDNLEKAQKILKVQYMSLSTGCDDVVFGCTKGVKDAMKQDMAAAKIEQDKAIAAVKKTTIIATAIMAILMAIGVASEIKNEKEFNDRVTSSKAEMAQKHADFDKSFKDTEDRINKAREEMGK